MGIQGTSVKKQKKLVYRCVHLGTRTLYGCKRLRLDTGGFMSGMGNFYPFSTQRCEKAFLMPGAICSVLLNTQLCLYAKEINGLMVAPLK